jgi:hypothetical protein
VEGVGLSTVITVAQRHEVRLNAPGDRDEQRFRCSCGVAGEWRDSVEGAEEDAEDHLEAVDGTFAGRPHVRFRL